MALVKFKTSQIDNVSNDNNRMVKGQQQQQKMDGHFVN